MNSLYECSNARVKGRVYCSKKHRLSKLGDRKLNIERLVRGDPLIFLVCQDCPDFDCMGPPIPKEERGWVTLLH